VLEAAPKFHVVALRAATADDSARIQRAMVASFPNVTAIDLALIMQTIDGIFTKVTFVIQFMAMFTVVTGIIVLVGAVLTGRYQRIRETVLLRTVGATRRQLNRILLVEYSVLGLLSAVVGAVLAIVANVLLARFVFKTTAAFPPIELGAAVLGVVAITLLAGIVANRGVTNHPPLEVLRQET
jgi:putative ABC transport system permease protein